VDVGEMIGSIVPTPTRSYNDPTPSKDLDLVEVIDKNEGFIGQFYASRANILKFHNAQSQLLTFKNKFQENIQREISREKFHRT